MLPSRVLGVHVVSLDARGARAGGTSRASCEYDAPQERPQLVEAAHGNAEGEVGMGRAVHGCGDGLVGPHSVRRAKDAGALDIATEARSGVLGFSDDLVDAARHDSAHGARADNDRHALDRCRLGDEHGAHGVPNR